MSFVFISHASPDKARVKPVVVALLDAGFGIWLDNPVATGFTEREIAKFHRIRAGNRWEDEIDDALREAACILVCWSRLATSEGVLSGQDRRTWMDEAGFARTAKKLVACTVDGVNPSSLPGQHSAQQLPCLDPDSPPSVWRAAMESVVADIRTKVSERSASSGGGRTAKTGPTFSAVINGDNGVIQQGVTNIIGNSNRKPGAT